MPFTLCLDVTLHVAAVPTTATVAVRLQAELTELAEDPRRWALRSITVTAEGGDLVVRARLLEPIEDLYGADPDAPGDLVAADVVLELLNRHCPTWRALEIGERPISAHTQRVRRRFWTAGDDQRAKRT
ncbi:hypothetical protein DSM104299_05187 [Baekduia alba]|uniref:hypothetical protein n=1 Tax=Baekduia alba TaxID=2997333 RepID=UPI002341F605|nr:hypothetical protein [Baekduia alba]WCB96428.1 hypothetical protein DSM104299_05187 [Baekduia alba]